VSPSVDPPNKSHHILKAVSGASCNWSVFSGLFIELPGK
jgi:hypothetical protein